MLSSCTYPYHRHHREGKGDINGGNSDDNPKGGTAANFAKFQMPTGLASC